MTGFEPATSTSRTQTHRVTSDSRQRLRATDDSGCTNGCTNSLENERGDVVDGLDSTLPDLLTIKADSFSAALAMIASLPLSDAEKAEAVRRVLSEQVGSTR